MIQLEAAKPPVSYYSYHNPVSQGALIRQTALFPAPLPERKPLRTCANFSVAYGKEDRAPVPTPAYPDEHSYETLHIDQLIMFDTRANDTLMTVMGTGPVGLPDVVQSVDERGMNALAAVAFGRHVSEVHSSRFIFWFNVSNGFSCTSIEAICSKKPARRFRPF